MGVNWMEDWIVENIEKALGFKLYDWQKDYIFNRSSHIPSGRRIGFTTAYILKLIISEGSKIRLDSIDDVRNICDDPRHGSSYLSWFINEFSDIYYKLSHTNLKRVLRPVKFKKGA